MKTGSLLCLLLCLDLASASARADGPPPAAAGAAPVDKAACMDAVFKGQRLREAHKLVAAREQLRVCARGECPAVVQTDCAGWLADVERTLPTVVLSAKDASGADVVEVRVSVDGEPLVRGLDGQAVAVDPGLRTFRFERADGTAATQQMLVKEGAKAQSVAVAFAGGGTSAPPASSPGSTQDRPGSTARLVGLILGGAGVVTMGAGVAVALDAKSKDNRAAGEPGTSRQTDSGSAVSEGNVATVVLGVGAALAAGGLVLWLTAPSETVAVGTDGRGVLLRGYF